MYPLSHRIKNGYEFLMYLILNEKNVHIWSFKKISKAKSNTKLQELKCSIHP